MTHRKKQQIRFIFERILLSPFILILRIPIFRKERKLQFTGKTLVFCGNNETESYLSTVFLQLFHSNLKQVYDLTENDSFLAGSEGCQQIVSIEQGFFKQALFFRKNKYKTVIDLRPTPSLIPAFAAFLGGIKYRVGFTVGTGNAFLNFNFPFNQFITHFTHQLKSLFESVTLQKIAEMPVPVLTSASDSSAGAYLTDISESYALVQTDDDNTWPVISSEKFLPFLLADGSLKKALICNDERYKTLPPLVTENRNIIRVTDISVGSLQKLCEGAVWYAGVNSLAAHLSAQYKKQTYVLFSSGNERLYQPFSVLSRAYTAPVTCRPCARPWLAHECENEIPHICTDIHVAEPEEKKPAAKVKKGRRSF